MSSADVFVGGFWHPLAPQQFDEPLFLLTFLLMPDTTHFPPL
jgi:hypothetical protein